MWKIDIDINEMVRFLERQALSPQEVSWIRERRIQQIVEMATEKGYYLFHS